jgi:hypothetical protein
MAQKARTKDESFMIRLHLEALKLPEIDDALDRYVIGEMVGLNKKAVDTICVLLAQANFIKKHGPIDISITPNGIRLVETIQQ